MADQPNAVTSLGRVETYVDNPQDSQTSIFDGDAATRFVEVAHADAIDTLDWLASRGTRPNLVYIDPPFASARDYLIRVKGPDDQRVERVAYSDRWDGLKEFMAFLRPVLERIHALLHDEGSLLVHCDHHASPYIALACDDIFGLGARGQDNHGPGFRNDLIWSYGLGGSSPRFWPRKHDTIYWYTKGTDWFFNAPRVPATSQRMRGKSKKTTDVLAIPTLNNMARERTGYPTQKPLALLETLIGAHSRPGELVLDVFGGSGTTALAAYRLGRRAIASDAADDSIALMRTRLLDAGACLNVWRARPLAERDESNKPPVFAARGNMTSGLFSSRSWCTDPDAVSAWLASSRGEDPLLVRGIDGNERLVRSIAPEE